MKKLQRKAVNLPGQTYECLLEIYRTPLCRELVISTVWKKLSQRAQGSKHLLKQNSGHLALKVQPYKH